MKLTSCFSILILLIVSLSSCKKDQEQSLKGRIVQSCDNPEPVAGEAVSIHLSEKSERSFEYSTTTDANGNFELVFEEEAWGTMPERN